MRRRGSGDAGADQEVGLLAQGGLGPVRRLDVAAQEEVPQGDRQLHGECLRVVRAEAHGAGGLLDRRLGLAEKALASALKCQTQARFWFSARASLEQGGAVVELAGDDDQRQPALASATASSRPSSTARRARRRVSAISAARSATQPKPLRCR